MESERIKRYIITIYHLEIKKGYATISEIARSLGLSASATSKMVAKLKTMGFVHFERYEPVTLTEKGIEIGNQLAYNHRILVNLFHLLGLEGEKIEKEVRKIEMVISPEVVQRIEKFLTSND